MRHPRRLLPLLLAGAASMWAQAPTDAYFEVQVGGEGGTEAFVLQLFDPTLIQRARDIVSGKETETVSVMGTVVKAPAFYNPQWHFHVDPGSVSFFSFATEVCDSSARGIEDHLDEVGGALLPNSVWCPWSSKVTREVSRPPEADRAVYVLSAANHSQAAVSPGALVSIYGSNFTDRTEQASGADLPLSLAGISVEIRSGEQPARKLPLIFASPAQINAVLPQDAMPGLQTASVVRADSTRMETQTYLASAAPALFFISRNGQNYAAATLLRVSPDGTRTTQSLVSVDPATGAVLPVPIDTNTPGDLYLSLYGTGFHQVGSDAVSVSVGSEEATVLYVGPQGDTMGLDQINIPLPRLVASTTSAAIEVSVATATGASMRANPVEVVIGGMPITAAR